MEQLENLENFSKVRVLVVGDIMLDRYWWGNVSRISPEAPVPVVHLNRTSLAAGGAANVAANIAGLTAEPFLIGMIGDDSEAELLPELLSGFNISADYLVKLPTRQTTVKTRIIAHSQQVVRVDQESKLKLTDAEEEEIWGKIEGVIKNIDLVVVSDYNKGFLTEELLKRLITKAIELQKFVLVDPKGKNYTKYRGATLLTPNLKELTEACGRDEYETDLIERAGSQLFSSLGLQALLVTQGENGMTLLEKNQNYHHLAARSRNVYDVTGAGDTVIAALSVCIGAGFSFINSARIANIAAGLVVEEVGTSIINFNKLKHSIDAIQ